MKHREYGTFKDEVPKGFEDFEDLNNLLESINYSLVLFFNVYEEVLIDNNTKNNSEIHKEIFRLIYEKKISCRKILLFGKLKYISYFEMCGPLIKQIYSINNDDGRNLLLFIKGEKKNYDLVINGKNGSSGTFEFRDYMNHEEIFNLLITILDIYESLK